MADGLFKIQSIQNGQAYEGFGGMGAEPSWHLGFAYSRMFSVCNLCGVQEELRLGDF
jgi:hypothetical protein